MLSFSSIHWSSCICNASALGSLQEERTSIPRRNGKTVLRKFILEVDVFSRDIFIFSIQINDQLQEGNTLIDPFLTGISCANKVAENLMCVFHQ